MAKLTVREQKRIEEGKKYSTASLKELTDLVNANEEIDFHMWGPASKNPNLSSKLIDTMVDKIEYDERKFNIAKRANDKSVTPDKKFMATFTSRKDSRRNVIIELSRHKNLGEDKMVSFLEDETKVYALIENPSFTPKHVDLVFDKIICPPKGSYHVFVFNTVMAGAHHLITSEMLVRWYNVLKKFADWSYGNNGWHSIIEKFLNRDDCPIDVLKGAISAPANNLFGNSERLRDKAVEHPLATPELQSVAYDITKAEKYLPQEAKDIFLF